MKKLRMVITGLLENIVSNSRENNEIDSSQIIINVSGEKSSGNFYGKIPNYFIGKKVTFDTTYKEKYFGLIKEIQQSMTIHVKQPITDSKGIFLPLQIFAKNRKYTSHLGSTIPIYSNKPILIG